MTRVAKHPIKLSKDVEIDLKADTITLKGPNGSLSLLLNKEIQVSQNESNLLVRDIIQEVNREKITTIDSFIEIIDRIKKTGRSSILLKIIRDEKSLWVTIKYKN